MADKKVMNTPVYPYVGYALTDFNRSIESQQDWAYEKLLRTFSYSCTVHQKPQRRSRRSRQKVNEHSQQEQKLKDTEFMNK